MNIKIGDHVAVLDDVLKGKVIDIKKDSITIESSEGFTFEFLRKDLVVIKEDQDNLSKFSDIANEDMYQKEADLEKSRPSPFKSDKNAKDHTVMEVDLHIEQLSNSNRILDKYDALNIQMETAKHKLEYAIRNRIPKLVFIHGKGAGILSKELEYLFKNYRVSAGPANFKKYGMGATEVYIHQNKKI